MSEHDVRYVCDCCGQSFPPPPEVSLDDFVDLCPACWKALKDDLLREAKEAAA